MLAQLAALKPLYTAIKKAMPIAPRGDPYRTIVTLTDALIARDKVIAGLDSARLKIWMLEASMYGHESQQTFPHISTPTMQSLVKQEAAIFRRFLDDCDVRAMGMVILQHYNPLNIQPPRFAHVEATARFYIRLSAAMYAGQHYRHRNPMNGDVAEQTQQPV